MEMERERKEENVSWSKWAEKWLNATNDQCPAEAAMVRIGVYYVPLDLAFIISYNSSISSVNLVKRLSHAAHKSSRVEEKEKKKKRKRM